jgi:hypothetical protein
MTISKLLSTQGPYLDALLEVGGQVVCVFDEVSLDARPATKPGEEMESRLQ